MLKCNMDIARLKQQYVVLSLIPGCFDRKLDFSSDILHYENIDNMS